MVIPIPAMVKRNSIEVARKKGMDPLNGISNNRNARGTTTDIVIISMMKQGMILPRISSILVMGATMSCSIVPISFSRTMTDDVRIVVRASMMITTTPGTKKSLEFRLGLNQALLASAAVGTMR